VSRDSAPEARKIVAQPVRAGYTTEEDFERRRCDRCFCWQRLRPNKVFTQTPKPLTRESRCARWIYEASSNQT
jgi:hypothetical protein